MFGIRKTSINPGQYMLTIFLTMYWGVSFTELLKTIRSEGFEKFILLSPYVFLKCGPRGLGHVKSVNLLHTKYFVQTGVATTAVGPFLFSERMHFNFTIELN